MLTYVASIVELTVISLTSIGHAYNICDTAWIGHPHPLVFPCEGEDIATVHTATLPPAETGLNLNSKR
jgi:hypothetical protein